MTSATITFDQCLFGYEDGHRLLATSMPLGEETSLLTELSDLAPQTVFGKSTGYWTGVPVPGIGRYALMRTWLAPEMPRPGCVWTHALLLQPDDLGAISDLSLLAMHARRPSRLMDRVSYREPITAKLRDQLTISTTEHFELLKALLGDLYGTSEPVGLSAQPGEADDVVFAAWSQQWPKLRRNLRFQTAASRGERKHSHRRLDVSVTFDDGGNISLSNVVDADWLGAAVQDATQGGSGTLRSFLRRYGADVRRQRGAFRPLVEIKLLNESRDPDAGARLLEIVTAAFPDAADGVKVKQAIIDGELVPAAQLEVLWFVLMQGGREVFPAPTKAGIERVAKLWPNRPEDLLHLAESTADADQALAGSIFDTVTSAVPLDQFWKLTEQYPKVRRRMVVTRPDLLLSGDLLALNDATIAEMVEVLPPDADIEGRLIAKVLSRDDTRLAKAMLDRAPRQVADQIIAAASGGTFAIGRAWLRELVSRPSVLLDPAVMKHVSRTSFLYELAETLGWLTPEVVAAGSEPWIAALVDVSSDLSDDRRDLLRVFLVALALASGEDGGRRLLEKFFDAVHHQIIKSYLPWRARDIIEPRLPDIGWSRNWDIGLRLRLAVATLYVEQGYPPRSYGQLATAKKTRVMLVEATKWVSGGEVLAQAVTV